MVRFPDGYSSKRQWGLQICQIALVTNSAAMLTGQISITEPNDGTILWSFANTATSATIGQILAFEDLTSAAQMAGFQSRRTDCKLVCSIAVVLGGIMLRLLKDVDPGQ